MQEEFDTQQCQRCLLSLRVSAFSACFQPFGHFASAQYLHYCACVQNSHSELSALLGGLIFIHLQCWEVLPFLTIQRQRCIKFLFLKDPEFYTLLALNCQKGQHLPALEVYKNQSPTPLQFHFLEPSFFFFTPIFCSRGRPSDSLPTLVRKKLFR